jgi:hypothetical protein
VWKLLVEFDCELVGFVAGGGVQHGSPTDCGDGLCDGVGYAVEDLCEGRLVSGVTGGRMEGKLTEFVTIMVNTGRVSK